MKFNLGYPEESAYAAHQRYDRAMYQDGLALERSYQVLALQDGRLERWARFEVFQRENRREAFLIFEYGNCTSVIEMPREGSEDDYADALIAALKSVGFTEIESRTLEPLLIEATAALYVELNGAEDPDLPEHFYFLAAVE